LNERESEKDLIIENLKKMFVEMGINLEDKEIDKLQINEKKNKSIGEIDKEIKNDNFLIELIRCSELAMKNYKNNQIEQSEIIENSETKEIDNRSEDSNYSLVEEQVESDLSSIFRL
jgi:hypothetical protein